mmetsp:Transcript_18461/g.44264  ORF Transcript_18461/g.44264 Transcript_18461/m.44264 type:complete len:280 (+) Transcript_18461:319-1158(+)
MASWRSCSARHGLGALEEAERGERHVGMACGWAETTKDERAIHGVSESVSKQKGESRVAVRNMSGCWVCEACDYLMQTAWTTSALDFASEQVYDVMFALEVPRFIMNCGLKNGNRRAPGAAHAHVCLFHLLLSPSVVKDFEGCIEVCNISFGQILDVYSLIPGFTDLECFVGIFCSEQVAHSVVVKFDHRHPQYLQFREAVEHAQHRGQSTGKLWPVALEGERLASPRLSVGKDARIKALQSTLANMKRKVLSHLRFRGIAWLFMVISKHAVEGESSWL